MNNLEKLITEYAFSELADFGNTWLSRLMI